MSDQSARCVPSASNGAARRHRVEGGRQHVLKLRLDDAEYDAITARAADSKVSVQRLLVSCALTRRSPASLAPSALAAELAGLRRLVANLANNINQIARRLNSGGVPDSSIPVAADAVRRAMLRLDSALSALTAEWPIATAASSVAPAALSARATATRSASPAHSGFPRPPTRNAPRPP